VKFRPGLGIAAGVVLLSSGPAHAFLGWPPMRAALTAANVDGRVVGALAIGWYFGSVAMLVFGVQMINAAVQVGRGNLSASAATKAIAVAYVVFGAVAFLARDLNPQFLFFIVTGVLAGVFAFWRPATRRRNKD